MAYDLITQAIVMGASQVALARGKEHASHCSRPKSWGSLDQEDALEKEILTHSSILAWRIPWTEEPGGLWFIGLQRVRHN